MVEDVEPALVQTRVGGRVVEVHRVGRVGLILHLEARTGAQAGHDLRGALNPEARAARFTVYEERLTALAVVGKHQCPVDLTVQLDLQVLRLSCSGAQQ
jgi:hypothetical protein